MNSIATPWDDRARVIHAAAASIDTRDWFADDELAPLAQFRLAKRREEWILSRVVLKQLARDLGVCGDVRRCAFVRPHVIADGARTDRVASISHSAGYAAAAIAREPVGIDVQVVRPIAEWSSHLFLSDEETRQMKQCAVADRLLHFWCAKEAAWKQRSDEFSTMKQIPLELEEERASGLLFDRVETFRSGEVIVALTR